MSRLPTPGADKGTWGDVLNDFLMQSHKPDGSLEDNVVTAAQIQDGAIGTDQLDTAVQTTLSASLDIAPLDKQWVIAGPINVASGDVDYIVPAYISVPSGYTAAVTGLRARINSGTSATLHMAKNGDTIPGLGTVSATQAGTSIAGLDVPLADGDLIAPIIDSTSGNPLNMTLMLSYTLTKL